MTTYTAISNTLVAVGAKPFASTIQALRDNPIAIAEGDDTAPRIVARARAFEFLPRVTDIGTTAVGYTDLDPKNIYLFFAEQLASSTSRVMQARASSNNGSSWGSWFAIYQSLTTNPTNFSFYVNNITGIWSSCSTSGSLFADVDLGVTNINAFQVRHSTSGARHTLIGHALFRGEVS
jgi:hypothetical protein